MGGRLAGRKFIEFLREELQPIRKKILNHPFPKSVERGKTPLEKLRFFAEQQFHIVSGDFRNLALYITLSKEQRERDFFLSLIEGERKALSNLFKLAKALGLGEKELTESEPHPGALSFTNYFTRLGVYGTPGDIASAIVIDFEVWGENCRRISTGLKKHYGLKDEDTLFLDGFYPIAPEFYRGIEEIVQGYIGKEESRKNMKTSAKLALYYELMFWDTMESFKPR